MKVTVIHATPNAENILIFTKNTRLNLSPEMMEEIAAWPERKKLNELEYMSRTIPSSHEFVDLIFLIEGVTRAFTHQLVRTRTASYAQQTMRVLDMEGFEYATGPSIQSSADTQAIYQSIMRTIDYGYKTLIDKGAKPEDARGILPTNILTNIVMKINLRAFCDLVRTRTSGRVQGEYANVLHAMITETRKVWPWLDVFITPKTLEAKAKITEYLKKMMQAEMQQTPDLQMNETEAWSVMKELDLIS